VSPPDDPGSGSADRKACPNLSVPEEQGTRFFLAEMIKIPVLVTRGSASVFDRLAIISEKQRHAVLATDDDGRPYTSLIAFALTPDRKSLIFATPGKSQKYRNIRKNSCVSVLIDTRTNTDRSYMQAEAVTVMGIARPKYRGRKRDALSRLFVKKHPKLAGFVQAEGTVLVEIEIINCFHVTSFQTVTAGSR